MTAIRILTTSHADLIPASATGREQVARRENPPKNTISNVEVGKLIGSQVFSRESVSKGLLREMTLRIFRKKST
jgi:hypothetical protein